MTKHIRMRRTQKNSLLAASILIGMLVVSGTVWYGGTHGWFNSLSNTYNNYFGDKNTENFFQNPDTIIDTIMNTPQQENMVVTLVVTPPKICVGDFVTGKISSNNLPGANCRVFLSANNGEWKKLFDVKLDNEGKYSQQTQIFSSGTARLAAICCSDDGLCRLSNFASLTSEVCGDDDSSDSSDDSSSYTCGVTSWCLTGSCPDGYDCVEVDNLATKWCACVNDANEVHADWKPGGENYNPR